MSNGNDLVDSAVEESSRFDFENGAAVLVFLDGDALSGHDEHVVLVPLNDRLRISNGHARKLSRLVEDHGYCFGLLTQERCHSVPFDFQYGLSFGVDVRARAQFVLQAARLVVLIRFVGTVTLVDARFALVVDLLVHDISETTTFVNGGQAVVEIAFGHAHGERWAATRRHLAYCCTRYNRFDYNPRFIECSFQDHLHVLTQADGEIDIT